jgi:hypothetical protein
METRLPTRQEIEELVAYLPRLYRNGFKPIKRWHGGEEGKDGVIQMPFPEYNKVVREFFHAAARECWRNPNYLSEDPARMLEEEDFIKTADLSQVKTMLTFCVRGERFCDGHWGAMIKSGHIRRLLKRLVEINKL